MKEDLVKETDDKCIELFKFLVLKSKNDNGSLLYLRGYAEIVRLVVYGEVVKSD